MTQPNRFVLEVDWDNDGDFGDAHEDLTADTLSFTSRRGRDSGANLTSRAVAGRLQAELRNFDGKFSRFNAESPLFGMLLPGRKVRLRATEPAAAVLWTGFLDRIEPKTGPNPTATLFASGPFIKLAGQNARVSPAPLQGVSTGVVVGAVLDDHGWPAGARQVDTGSVQIGHWYVDERETLTALREMEEAEGGFLYEGLDWDIVFHGRYWRDLNATAPLYAFSDAPDLPPEGFGTDLAVYAPLASGGAVDLNDYVSGLTLTNVNGVTRADGPSVLLPDAASFARASSQTLTNASALFNPSSQPFGIAIWAKPSIDATVTNPSLISKWADAANRGWTINRVESTSRMVFLASADGSALTSTSGAFDDTLIADDEWGFVAAWWDGAALNCQVNMGTIRSIAFAGSVFDSTAPLTLGGRNTTANLWDGQIAGASIWMGRVPSQSELAWHYNDGLGRNLLRAA